MTPRSQKILVRVVPSILLLLLVLASVHGGDSVLRYWELERAAVERRAEWASQQRENTLRLLELRNLERDPINFERLAAERLGWAGEGATLYYFDEDGAITEP